MSMRIAQGLRAGGWVVLLTVSPCAGFAHVTLDAPNGGESFVAGSVAEIEWHVQIAHNTLDWDLWYSTESSEGPWQEISMDIAAGDISDGAVHTFDWLLPNQGLDNAWVRVRQDNGGQDYYDVSDNSFRISAVPNGGGDFTGDGNVDADDLAAWERGFGTQTGAMPDDGDADLDRDVDGADFLAWQQDFDASGMESSVNVVPEPTAAFLAALAALGFGARR